MIVAVLFVIVMIALLGWPSSLYLLFRVRVRSPTMLRIALMSLLFLAAAVLSVATWWFSMRAGVRALEETGRTA